MKKLAKKKYAIEREDISRADALALFEKKGRELQDRDDP